MTENYSKEPHENPIIHSHNKDYTLLVPNTDSGIVVSNNFHQHQDRLDDDFILPYTVLSVVYCR